MADNERANWVERDSERGAIKKRAAQCYASDQSKEQYRYRLHRVERQEEKEKEKENEPSLIF